MPNQYSANDFTNVPQVTAASDEETMAARGTSSFVIDVLNDANPTAHTVDRNPQQSASGVAGINSVPLTGSLSGGTGDDKVVDVVDAPASLNVNPWAPDSVT